MVLRTGSIKDKWIYGRVVLQTGGFIGRWFYRQVVLQTGGFIGRWFSKHVILRTGEAALAKGGDLAPRRRGAAGRGISRRVQVTRSITLVVFNRLGK